MNTRTLRRRTGVLAATTILTASARAETIGPYEVVDANDPLALGAFPSPVPIPAVSPAGILAASVLVLGAGHWMVASKPSA